MKTIKSVTFEALDNLSNVICQYRPYKIENVKIKISDFLILNGNKRFVEVYNELAVEKDISKTINILKIE
jgi:hypothetical protein